MRITFKRHIDRAMSQTFGYGNYGYIQMDKQGRMRVAEIVNTYLFDLCRCDILSETTLICGFGKRRIASEKKSGVNTVIAFIL